MKVKNISTTVVHLPFVPVTIEPGQTVEIDNSFIYHPQMISLVNAASSPVVISEVDSLGAKSTSPTINQKGALDRSKNPSAGNEFITSTDYTIRMGNHAKEINAHHNNTNDPTTNEKEAMKQSAAASGLNPFSTVSDKVSTVNSAIASHLIAADHSPPSFTQDEIDGIKAATALSTSNAAVSVSYLVSDTASKIGAHASDAVAHHSNTNDPSSDEKAAMGAASAPAVGNPFQVATDLSTHVAIATAHHSNVNDPSLNQKQGMDNANPAITSGNPVVTAGDNGLMSTDEAAAMNAANPALSVSNPVVGENFPGVSTTNHLTTNQRESLENAGVALTSGNPVISEGSDRLLSTAQVGGVTGAASPITGSNPVVASNDARLLTTDQKAAAANADSPAAGNPFSVTSDITTHTSDVDAHHDNSNDPTSDQKAAMTNADSPASGNPFGVISDITTHTSDVDAHHDNSNDPTTDQKAALDGTSGTPPTGSNKLVDNADSRLTNDRDPNNHASEHTDGTDDIQLATSSVKGLMSTTFATLLNKLNINKNDCKLVRNSTTQLNLEGVVSKIAYVNGEEVSLTSDETLITSANIITSVGDDGSAAMTSSTLYYIYLSNSLASYAPNEIRASTTAPSYDSTNDKEMLATSGNGQNWMFVGWAVTDGSTQFLNVLSVASRYNLESEILSIQGSGSVSTSVDATWETLTGVQSVVLLPPGKSLEVSLSMPCEHSSTGIAMLIGVHDGTTDTDIVEAETGVASSEYALAGKVLYKNNTATPTVLEYSARHKYSTAAGSSTSADKGRFSLVRN